MEIGKPRPRFLGQEEWLLKSPDPDSIFGGDLQGSEFSNQNPQEPQGQYFPSRHSPAAPMRWTEVVLGITTSTSSALLPPTLPPSPLNATTFGRKARKGSLFIKVTLDKGAGTFPWHSAGQVQPCSLLQPPPLIRKVKGSSGSV